MKSELDITAEAPQTKSADCCPACGGSQLERFFELSDLPVNCIALLPTREAALKCPKGRMDLGFCTACGAISNLAFDAARLTYDRSYDNSLHFSPTFQKYAEEVAHHLVERFDLHGKTVIDVGCGNGEFLSLVCGLGNNSGIGFDPSFLPGRANLQAGKGVTIVQDYYSEKFAHHDADFIMCRHVLEHIYNPHRFLRSLRQALSRNTNAAIFFEVPSAAFVFENKGMWDVIYEHCFYYYPGALARLFSSNGFDVLNVSETFHGQYVCLEARVSQQETGNHGNLGGSLHAFRRGILKFAEEYRSSRTHWQNALSRFAAQGKRVGLWGAGAKGAMFLNAFRSANSPEYIVDVNPHKHGLFVPGTGQEVVGPEKLKEFRPDVLLIVNPNYREEISRQVLGLGIAPELISI
jgi:SAM-dependent methyltransferase